MKGFLPFLLTLCSKKVFLSIYLWLCVCMFGYMAIMVVICAAQYEELKKERDMLKQFYVINQPQQLPDFLKIKPVDNYQLLNFNLNHTAFNPFLEPAAVGMSQIMINQNLNQTYYEQGFNRFSFDCLINCQLLPAIVSQHHGSMCACLSIVSFIS